MPRAAEEQKASPLFSAIAKTSRNLIRCSILWVMIIVQNVPSSQRDGVIDNVETKGIVLMQGRNRLGIFSWFGFVLPLPERLRLIKEAGFDAVSIWWEDEMGNPPIKKEYFSDMVKDSGLILENIHVPFNESNDLWSEQKIRREERIKEHIAWIEDCARHGIPMMVMHLTEGLAPPEPNRYGIESLLSITRRAEEAGVKIAIENTRREDNVPFVLREIQSAYLGCCFDSSHANLYRDKGEYLSKQFGNRLLATHLSDNDGIEDRHWLPGNGLIDWQKLQESLTLNSYDGYLTLEIYPNQEEIRGKPKMFIEKAFQSLSKVAGGFAMSHKDSPRIY